MQEKSEYCRKNAPKMHDEAVYDSKIDKEAELLLLKGDVLNGGLNPPEWKKEK